MIIKNNSKVAIGTDQTPVGLGDADLNPYHLFVAGGILTEEVRVRTGWADYVFEEDYSLLSLEELEQFVKQEKHLPGVPGANKIDKEGYYSADAMFKGQLKNIEELVLHTIAQEKKIEQQSNAIESLLQRITALEKRLDQ